MELAAEWVQVVPAPGMDPAGTKRTTMVRGLRLELSMDGPDVDLDILEPQDLAALVADLEPPPLGRSVPVPSEFSDQPAPTAVARITLDRRATRRSRSGCGRS